MNLDISNMGFCYRDEFERNADTLKKIVSPEIYYLIIDQCTNKKGQIIYAPLNKIVDAYKYYPHLQNKSKYQPSKSTLLDWKDSNISKKIYEHYRLLGIRIEEKFIKITKAFRFFDIEKVHYNTLIVKSLKSNQRGYIKLADFKQGLDQLAMRLEGEDTKNLFDFLDRV